MGYDSQRLATSKTECSVILLTARNELDDNRLKG